ncbi:MAG: TetR/AcrR family transcriptional regulator [Nocardioides sp.]
MAPETERSTDKSRTRNRRGAGALLREELIVAGTALADEGGADALTLRAVARRAGVVPQSVYLHFADREDLWRAVLRHCFASLLDVTDRAAAGAGQAPHTRLRARSHAFSSFGISHPHRYRLMFSRHNPVRHDVPLDDLPGASLFRAFEADVVSTLGDTAGSAGCFELTTDLLATLHGAVALRTNLPSFPWPPVDGTVERAVDRLVDLGG